MTDILDRWLFDESTAKTIAGLIANGFVNVSTCTYGGNLMDCNFFNEQGVKVEISFRYMTTPKPVRNLGNKYADEGLDRCVCGSKYWERDRCVDCNTHILVHRARIVAGGSDD